MRELYILILLTVALTSSVMAQTKLNTNDFIEAFQAQNKAQLIDVRTAEEYSAGHIAEARNINWNDSSVFAKSIKKLKKKKPVYIYCLSGGRSAKAAQALILQGFTVFELEGGYRQYELKNTKQAEVDIK